MQERVTRGKAIRLKCLDCCGGNSVEVRLCPCENCALWAYRMGREVEAGLGIASEIQVGNTGASA